MAIRIIILFKIQGYNFDPHFISGIKYGVVEEFRRDTSTSLYEIYSFFS